jgi:hypothetical protein
MDDRKRDRWEQIRWKRYRALDYRVLRLINYSRTSVKIRELYSLSSTSEMLIIIHFKIKRFGLHCIPISVIVVIMLLLSFMYVFLLLINFFCYTPLYMRPILYTTNGHSTSWRDEELNTASFCSTNYCTLL